MRNELDTAFSALSAAEQLALHYWRNTLRIRTKSDARDLVTQADVAVDRAVRKIIHTQFPAHDVLSEELGTSARTSDNLWVIDPIDGTINFTMGEPLFGVSIALFQHDTPVVAAISFPALTERYWAVRGGGAWMQHGTHRKQRCRVSRVSRIRDARFSMGFNVTSASRRRFLRSFSPLVMDAAVARLHFCAVFDFMNVARGGMDFYVNYDIHLWDFAAAWLIVEEAGGQMRTTSGKPLTMKDTDIVAINDNIDRALFRYPL